MHRPFSFVQSEGVFSFAGSISHRDLIVSKAFARMIAQIPCDQCEKYGKCKAGKKILKGKSSCGEPHGEKNSLKLHI